CPICSRGLQISDAQRPYIRSMSGATASFRAGRLAEAPYMAQVERFWRQLGVNPAGQQLLAPGHPGASAPARPPTPVHPAPPPPPPPAGPGAPAPPPPAAPAAQRPWLAQFHKL